MKKFLVLIVVFTVSSCWKNNQEAEKYVAEDTTPIDTTVVDSVVGQASFSQINAMIEDSKKPKDSVKILTPEEKLAKEIAEKEAALEKAKEEKLKKEDAAKSEADKKLAEQKAKEEAIKSAEKEKQQQEKKVDELVENPENKQN